ncbi:MAG: positive regulator of CheA protein [Pseudomonadota bacterium]|jgi:purine-binding chemotaxis protein CheW
MSTPEQETQPEQQALQHSSPIDRNRSDINNRYLCFTLGEEDFAVPLLSVKEVIALPDITPVPQTPPHFLGIMNLRGQVISIMDLRAKLSIKPLESPETAVIICDLKPNSIGVVVDSINSVVNPAPDQISDKPDMQGHKNSDYIQGIYREKERLILLLDISKTLSSGDKQAISKATAPPAQQGAKAA